MITVAEHLTRFLLDARASGIAPEVRHEAQRLLLNQFKASVAATNDEVIRILHQWSCAQNPTGGGAHVLWIGTELAPSQAAMVNGALFEVLDFHDTYIPTFMHAVSAVLPAVLAVAETGSHSGEALLTALALGVEAELAVATMLMPTGYYRGFVPAGLVGGVGAAAACSVLAGLDARRTCHALGIAMCSAFGLYESVGSMTLAYITGATARSGLTAFQLAECGMDAPRTAFEGEKGMFLCHSDEQMAKCEAVIASLGHSWRLLGQSYKTVPTETITHAPIECALEIRARAGDRRVQRMRFGVNPIVVKIADERRERFGRPSSELTARFDTRYCAAAAWTRGRFTLAEMLPSAYTDPEILDLRDRIDLVADQNRATFEGCWLEAEFFDGTSERVNVDFFLGSPGRRMSDEQLSGVFRSAAAGWLSPSRTEAVLEAAWELDAAADAHALMSLARLDLESRP